MELSDKPKIRIPHLTFKGNGQTHYAVEVVDNLESDDADKALSARQGKRLKEEINQSRTWYEL